MGRSIRHGESGSGKIGENSRITGGDNRMKQKKRKKDLEKLHRNVLEARKNLHRGVSREHGKRKSILSKVLTNFADKRQRNDETTHAVTGKKGKTNSKTICNRLLPEQIVGLYRNGAKGRQARRVGENMDGTNIARLEDNILKLLDGDETNPKWSGNRGKPTKKRDLEKESVHSNCTSQCDPPFTDEHSQSKTNGDGKWINRENEKNVAVRGQATKSRVQPIPQRETTCKRRLFESNGDSDENSFGFIDRSEIMNDICFTPTRRNAVDYSPPGNRVEKYVTPEEKEDGAKRKSEGTFDWRRVKRSFWGWSPDVCYERLCAKVCVENFEKNEFSIALDPMVKAQKDLSKFYALTRHDACSEDMTIKKTPKDSNRGASGHPKQSLLDNFSSTQTFVETNDSANGSELDSDSTNSAIKVGSWHPKNLSTVSSENADTLVDDENGMKDRRGDEPGNIDTRRKFIEAGARRNEENLSQEPHSSTDKVMPTIKSVERFLRKMRHNPLNSPKRKQVFAPEFTAVAGLYKDQEDSDNFFRHPRYPHNDANGKKFPRVNTKHVPTILRRSNARTGLVANAGQEKLDPHSDARSKECTENDYSYRGGTSSDTGHIVDIEDVPTVETRDDFMRNWLKPAGRKEETKTSSDSFADGEFFVTGCAGMDPEDRYDEQLEELRKRDTQRRDRGRSCVAFDIDERPHNFYASQPSDRRPELSPRSAYTSERIATHSDDPRSAASEDFFKSRIHERRSSNKTGRRKPVALFQPIQDFGHNTIATMSNAVKNLNVRTVPKDTEQPVFASQIRISPCHRAGRSFVADENPRHRSVYDTQPDKFLAFDNGEDSGRIPIYANAEYPRTAVQVSAPVNPQLDSMSQLFKAKPEIAEITYANRADAEESKEQSDRHHHHHYYHHYYPRKEPRLAVPSSLSQQMTSNGVVIKPAPTLGPTSNNVPRNVQDMPIVESFAADSLDYQSSFGVNPNDNGEFREDEILPTRIQLPDGTTGIYVPDNGMIGKARSIQIDQQHRHKNHHGVTQLPLAMACSSTHLRKLNNIGATTASVLGSTSNNVSRNVYSTTDLEPIASTRIGYQPLYGVNTNFTGGPRENGSLVRRVRLTDGTTGIFVPESDNTVPNDNHYGVPYNQTRTNEPGFY